MSEWPLVRLADVTTQVQDAVKVESGQTYPLLGVRWYAGGPFLRESVTIETSKATRFFRVTPGQFIYNRLFAWKGSFGLVDESLAGSFVSNEFPLFECDTKRLLPDFLNLHFRIPHLWTEIERVSTGTTASRNRWKETQFGDHTILLPPLGEQRRIVDIVGAVDAQIDALAHEAALGEKFNVRCRLALTIGGADGEWRTRAFSSDEVNEWTSEVPEGWAPTTIGAVATVRSGATPRRSEQERYFDGGDIHWVKTGDLNESVIAETDERITTEALAETSVRLLPVDTVLVAMYGGFGQIGRSARLGVPAATNQAVSALTELRHDVLPAYLHEVLKAGRPKWRRVAASSRKDPNIGKRDIEEFDFPLPSLAEQAWIASTLELIQSDVASCLAELANLRTCRSALLSSLLTQGIEIPESYDSLLEEAS